VQAEFPWGDTVLVPNDDTWQRIVEGLTLAETETQGRPED